MEMNGKIFACNVIWGDDIMRPVRHRMRVKKCGHFGVNEWQGGGVWRWPCVCNLMLHLRTSPSHQTATHHFCTYFTLFTIVITSKSKVHTDQKHQACKLTWDRIVDAVNYYIVYWSYLAKVAAAYQIISFHALHMVNVTFVQSASFYHLFIR